MPGSLRDDRLDAPSAKVLRRGFRILGVAIVEQPKVFTIAALGSAVFGLMTVASSWVLGWVTTRVILPAFATGHARTGALVGAAAAIMAVAVIKAAGIVVRRVGASVMQFNLQASYRRRVTRQYLRLPLSWHQRHSTGQLLSNANADVESAWYPIAPFPFSIGVLVMLGVAGVAMVRADPVVALVAFVLFPAIAGMNFVYQRRLSPVATRAQELRGAVSGVAHESFDGALVVKALGRETSETERFAAPGQRAAGRQHRRRPDPRPVRPGAGGRAQPRRPRRAHCGHRTDVVWRAERRRAGPDRLPVHHPGVPGPGVRVGAGGDAAQRRRLGPGDAGSGGDRVASVRSGGARRRRAARARAAVGELRLRRRAGAPGRHLRSGAGPDRGRGRSDRFRQVDAHHAACPAGGPDLRRGAVRRRRRPWSPSWRGVGERPPWCLRRPSCSRTRCAAT